MLKTTLSSLIFIVSINYAYSVKSEAKCALIKNPSYVGDNNIEGIINLFQEAEGQLITYDVDIIGFKETGKKHGFHVHESPDISVNCENAKAHFNPYGKEHGGPEDKERHVGDLGNIEVDGMSQVKKKIFDKMGNLFLGKDDTIINKTIVLHEGVDDLGKGGEAESKKTGNAGKRLACCVITCSSGGCKSSAVLQTRLSLWTILLVFFFMAFKHTLM